MIIATNGATGRNGAPGYVTVDLGAGLSYINFDVKLLSGPVLEYCELSQCGIPLW